MLGGLKQTVQHFNNLHFLLILEHYILAISVLLFLVKF